MSMGWDESVDMRKGYFDVGSKTPEKLGDVIIQGPHFWVATPLAKEPRESMRSSADYDELDLENLPADFIPRTNYQPIIDENYNSHYTHWEWAGESVSARSFYRLAWRKMVNNTNERTLIPTILPPGITHIDSVVSAGPFHDDEEILVYLGLLSSLPYDFVIRASAITNLRLQTVEALPRVLDLNSSIPRAISQVTARLACLTTAYAPLWEKAMGTSWNHNSPERNSLKRRSLLIELDVLAAMHLGIALEELVILYRTQFPVLKKYEDADLYDKTGRKLPSGIARDFHKFGDELPEEAAKWVHPQSGLEYIFEFPFRTLDREQNYRDSWRKFERELGVTGHTLPVADSPMNSTTR